MSNKEKVIEEFEIEFSYLIHDSIVPQNILKFKDECDQLDSYDCARNYTG